MAAGQYTSHPKNSLRKTKYFTLAEANRSLPLVARVVRDIVNTHERAAQLQAKIEEVSSNAREAAAVQGQLEMALENLQEYVDELLSIGVELKDYESGLIDFPGRHQGRDVYLCWKPGEDRIEYWHELHTGFAGRQAVDTLEEDE